MKIEQYLTIETIFRELVRRAIQRRIELGLTQAEAAEQSGVSLRTLKNFESCVDCRISTFLRLLQTYDLLEPLDQLIPESSVSPIKMLEQQPKLRQRASHPKKRKPTKPWKWGNEQ